MTFYPSSIPTFPTQTNKIDLADAVLINTMCGEVNAIATAIGTNPKGSMADLVDRLAVIIGTDGAIRKGSAFPGTTKSGMLYFKTDEDKWYGRNAADSDWDVIGATLDYDNGTTYEEAIASTERFSGAITNTKIKELSPLLRDGNITIQLDAKSSVNGQINWARIYLDGVGQGTAFQVTSNVYGTFYYNNLSVAAGQQVQLYGSRPGSETGTLYIKNFAIRCENPTSIAETSGY